MSEALKPDHSITYNNRGIDTGKKAILTVLLRTYQSGRSQP